MKSGFCLEHGDLTEDNAYVCITNRVKAGYRLRCKECSSASRKKMYDKKREQYIEYASKYVKENKDKVNERRRAHRIANLEKYREADKKRYYELKAADPVLYSTHQTLRKRKLTMDKYLELIKTQNNLCAICNKPETKKSTRGNEISPLAIDHCHKTNKVRALLCRKCNIGLGSFDDNIDLLQSAIRYLTTHKDEA